MKDLIKAVWHFMRYSLATAISTAVSGLFPLLAASVPILMSVAWVLVWVLDFAVYALIGESMLQGVLVDDPFGIALVPVLAGGVGVASVAAISIAVVALNVLIVMPVSLVTELLCQRLSVHRVVSRLGAFLVSGLLLGVVVAGFVMGLFGFYHPDSSLSALVLPGLVIAVMCVGIVFVFGTALTLLSAFKDLLVRLKSRREQSCVAVASDEI